jgi:hypothetical protein
MPSSTFISLDNLTITVTPTKPSDIGESTLNLTLSDGLLNSSYALTINVTNTAPKFMFASPKDQSVDKNSSRVFALPLFIDDEQ